MYRRCGPIPALKKDRFPSSLVVFDSEAVRGGFIDGVELQVLRFGVARHLKLDESLDPVEDSFLTFREVSELSSFIELYTRKDRSLFVYAHNLKYDLQLTGLLTDLLSRKWEVGLFVAEDPPTFLRLKRGRSSIMMVDTFNYWQFSLAKMGEQLKLPKLPMPGPDDPFPTWETYCRRDVEVLSSYLLSFMRFLRENDLAGLGLTLASQSFRSFRHKFMSSSIVLHDDPKSTLLERDGYSGGRVEAFLVGTRSGEELFKLDVNSMYPFVMREREYPSELVSYSEDVPLRRLRSLLSSYYCLAEVELDSLVPIYALKTSTKLIFPVGTFRTVLHHGELVEAVRRGHLVSCLRLAIYKRSPLFVPFVDFFYGLKREAELSDNPVLRHQAKIILNALYGKFGQREVVSRIEDNPGPDRFARMLGYSESLGRTVEVNYLGNKIELRYSGGESTYSFPAIAGGVTSYARLHLWGLIERAGRSHVFYVDTDSLILDRVGYEALSTELDPLVLGKLKLESSASELVVRGAKDYSFGGEVKHKGVPKSALELGPNQWQYEQFRGFKTWLSDGMTPGVLVFERLKTRRSAYDKGEVFEDGRVLPWSYGYGGNGGRGRPGLINNGGR